MNDIRRTILWVIFGFSMVMLWDQWQVHNGRPATFLPQRPTTTASAPVAPASGVPQASTVPAASTGASAPATAAVPGATAVPAAAPAAPRERITVTTDVMKLTFDTEGGSVVRSEFLEHPSE